MLWKEKVVQVVSGLFMGFIVLLIVIAFGMPDFITSSAEAKRSLMAQVGDLPIYPYDVGRHKEAILNRFGQENIPDSLRSYVESQALESAIQEKLFYLLTRETRFLPRGEARQNILARFYRENLTAFMKDGKFDFAAFEATLGRQNRSRIDFDNKVVDEAAMSTLERLLRDISFSSRFEDLDFLQLQKARIELRLLALQDSRRQELILKRVPVEEAEIQEKFRRDYLSKDPKEKLTSLKREAIVRQIQNEKKGAAEEKFLAELSRCRTLNEVKNLVQERIIELKDISPIENWDAKKPQNYPSLIALQKSDTLLHHLFRDSKDMIRLHAAGTTYFVEILKLSWPSYPSGREIIEKEKKGEKALTDELVAELEKEKKGLRHYNVLFASTMDLLRQKTSIRRYRQREES
ncbi:MAG: SurA N-terminal domain-containing protein [Leptospiraceae bacterium]|nr:SurA N-terminal domain-containing protein [Leptospiraceae bacterium]MDW8306172.1 SurA N-terminal domain-containing protein [Leptospiraceae bacterium]